MLDPELLLLEKMMVLIPRFASPGSGLLVRLTEKVPENTTHDQLIRETMRYIRDPAFLSRFNEYERERRTGCMTFRGVRHKEMFEREVRKRKNPTAAMLCVLYLLTADCRLWAHVRSHVHAAGIQFQNVKIGGLSPDAYTL